MIPDGEAEQGTDPRILLNPKLLQLTLEILTFGLQMKIRAKPLKLIQYGAVKLFPLLEYELPATKPNTGYKELVDSLIVKADVLLKVKILVSVLNDNVQLLPTTLLHAVMNVLIL
jgi:hypothetical protein